MNKCDEILTMDKFVSELNTTEWEVETPFGWQSFSGIGKTIEFQEYVITTKTGKTLICADDHILLDENWEEVFCKNLKYSDFIQTRDGIEQVISVEAIDNYSSMYDLLNVENGNLFYSNNIVSHNSTTVVSYLLHYTLFNDNVKVAILANKSETSREILSRYQLAYENLPRWLQQGVGIWNKGSVELENGSKAIAASTSSSAIRGNSFNCIVLDEFAHIPNHIAENFFASVYPTVSSGKTTKVIIISTPSGLNLFYKLWHDAELGRNEYVPFEIHWSELPGRDEKWKEQTIANSGLQNFRREFECEFLGSVNTLIHPTKLKNLVYENKIKSNANLDIYEDPKKDHLYIITVDVSRGTNNDYSAFVIIDATNIPYTVVGKYRNNEISPLVYPSIIEKVAKSYNNAFLLIEVNDIGAQIGTTLNYDLEYPNILMCAMRGRAGQIVGHGFSGMRAEFGVKMSKTTKKVGASNLKTLIEDDKLIVKDYEIIQELTTFIEKNSSYEAEDGCNDDLVMCIHRDGKIYTEDGIKKMKWVVDTKYSGKVLSLDSNGKFVWSKVIGHSVKPNINKKWIQIRGKSRNTLTCTTDHKVAYIEDVFNPKISYIDAELMVGKYNVIQTEKKFHISNPLYNKEQLSVIIGSLIGDSSISKSGKLICAHSELQKEYSEHKHTIFKGTLDSHPPRGGSKTSYCVNALTNGQTHKLRELMYVDGKKTISNIIDFIDEISLAYWYMDDGQLESNSVLLCTDSFSYEDNVLLQNMLWNKFRIHSKVSKNINCRTGKEYYRIFIETEDEFFKKISPYVIDSMKYKLPEKYKNIKNKDINSDCLDYGAEKIIKIKQLEKKGEESKLYDITVENTHNFICNGMVVHNCLIIFSWLSVQPYFKEMTNDDIRKRIVDDQEEQLEQDMSPFGFINNGTEKEIIIDDDGDVWFSDGYGNILDSWVLY